LDRSQRATSTGAILIGAGLGLGGVEMVTTHEEAVRLAADCNRELATRKEQGAQLRILPALAPGHAGLLARLTF